MSRIDFVVFTGHFHGEKGANTAILCQYFGNFIGRQWYKTTVAVCVNQVDETGHINMDYYYLSCLTKHKESFHGQYNSVLRFDDVEGVCFP